MSPKAHQNNAASDAPARGKVLLDLIDQNTALADFGFRLGYTRFVRSKSLVAIYDSEWCRVSFRLSPQPLARLDELVIDYGRLHAPSESAFMEWAGEKCRCWHNVMEAIDFIDGLSPREAFEQLRIHQHAPAIVREFRHSEIGKRLATEYPPKSAVVLHSVLWKHYGLRLFELFDLRKPDLWQQYRAFLAEYYGLLGRKPLRGPPYDKVC